MEDQALRESLCRGAAQLWMRGLIVGDGGLVSTEAGRRRFLVTPLGRRRSGLRPEELLLVDIGGADVAGGPGIPPQLWRPHRLAYQSLRDNDADHPVDHPPVHATVLATPPSAMALALLHPDMPLLQCASFGPAMGLEPDEQRLHALDAGDEPALRDALLHQRIVLLRGLGVLTAAGTLEEALNLIEGVEYAASLTLACAGQRVPRP
ncbi:MAG: class II aldolase/adducin family protein [Phycisphaeraceae bacterium]